MKALQIITAHASDILTFAGIASMSGAAVLSSYGAHKATLKIEGLKEVKAQSLDPNLTDEEIEAAVRMTTKEIVKEVWVDFVPAAACLLTGITCILIAKRIDAAKIAALASTAALLDEKLHLHDKAMEKLDPADREKVQEILDQEVLKQAGPPPWKDETALAPIAAGDGASGQKMLCLESLSGQYFWSNPDIIRRSVSEFNSWLTSTGMVGFGAHGTVNDWFDILDQNLEHTELFSVLGWNSEHMLDITLDSRLNEVDRPVLIVNYHRQPKLTDDYLYSGK